MKEVQAELDITLVVDCPHCEACFDMFDIDNGRLNDDGYLIRSACPQGSWNESHEKFEETVQCPSCGKEMVVKGINW